MNKIASNCLDCVTFASKAGFAPPSEKILVGRGNQPMRDQSKYHQSDLHGLCMHAIPIPYDLNANTMEWREEKTVWGWRRPLANSGTIKPWGARERAGGGGCVAYITIWHTHQTICMRAESNLPHTFLLYALSLALALSFFDTRSRILSLSVSLSLLYLFHSGACSPTLLIMHAKNMHEISKNDYPFKPLLQFRVCYFQCLQ